MTTKEKAANVLVVMYKRGNGSTTQVFNVEEICEELGFSEEDTDRIWQYLCDNDYIDGMFGGRATLTIYGAELAEEILAGKNPFEPISPSVTVNYGPNINIGGDVSGSNIATQGTATVNYIQDAYKMIEEKAGPDAEAIKALLDEVIKELEAGKSPKGVLDKSKDFLSKYGWVPSLIGNVILRKIGLL